MKSILTTITFLLFLTLGIIAQDIYFEKNFSFPSFNRNYGSAAAFVPADSSYILLADLSGCGNCPGVQAIIKVNSFGDTVWTILYNTGHAGFATYNIFLSINSYIIIGGYEDNEKHLVILKTDTSGNVIVTNDYSLGADGTFYGTAEQKDDTIFLFASSSQGGLQFLKVFKIKPDGDTLLTRTYGDGSIVFYPFAVSSIEDSLILLAEIVPPISQGSKKLFFFDQNLDTLYSELIPSSANEHFIYLSQDPVTKNYTMAGHVDTTSGKDFCFRTLDSNYQTINFKSWGTTGSDFFSSVKKEGNIFVATGGYNYVFNTSGNLFIMRLDSAGDTLSVVLYGQQFNLCTGSVLLQNTDHGSFALGAGTYGPTNSNTDIYYLKTDSNGLITNISFNFLHPFDIRLLTYGETYYLNSLTGQVIKKIIVYDINGQELIMKENEQTINLSGYASGLYFFEVILEVDTKFILKVIKF